MNQTDEVINGSFEYEYKGKAKMGFYISIPRVKWLVIYAVDMETILASVNEIINITVLVNIGALLIGGILAFIFAGRLTAPIKRITQLLNLTQDLILVRQDDYDDLLGRSEERRVGKEC